MSDTHEEMDSEPLEDAVMEIVEESESADDEASELDQELSDDPEQRTQKRLSLSARISALLFVATKPLSSSQLSAHTKASTERVEKALEEISELYQEDIHGFSLLEVAGGWQLRTSPHVASTIHRLIPPRARRLSRAAAETLAVVAYKQPVQRAEIEAIRGVDALPTIKTLLDAKLIRIVGREAAAGTPALYGTTQTFLEKFGMRDLSELPTPRELFELSQEPGEADDAMSSSEDDEDIETGADTVNEEGTPEPLAAEIEVSATADTRPEQVPDAGRSESAEETTVSH